MATKTSETKTTAAKRTTARKTPAKKATAAMTQGQSITIDGREYDLNALSDEARTQLANVRAVDQELARLQQQVAIAQTARHAYANALKNALAEQ